MSVAHTHTRPLLLQADNFTPLSRTPWAGDRLGRSVKSEFVKAEGTAIGEAWEFSCDPALLSRLAGGTSTLVELIKRHPAEILSPEQLRRGKGCEILVKLLDAAEPLSLQVHPTDDDPALKPGECGKPESWLILAATPGAGLYLGFSRRMSKSELRRLLADGDRAKDVLHFVPVKPGEYFEIEAGVPHAIGAGVTLLEPQRICPGLSGKTYRMWDWGRKYDAAGHQHPQGQPRELHVEESIALVDPERQVGDAFVNTLRRAPVTTERETEFGTMRADVYPANYYYQTAVFELPRGVSLRFGIADGYGAMIPLEGALDCRSLDGHIVRVPKGQPALLPYAAMPLSFTATATSRFAVVVPAGARLEF